MGVERLVQVRESEQEYYYTRYSDNKSFTTLLSTPVVGKKWRLEDIRLHLSGVGVANDFVVSIYHGTLAAYNLVIAKQSMAAVADFRYQPDKIDVLGANDGVLMSWTNGTKSTGTLTFAGVVNDGQTVTIGTKVFEFDTNSSVGAGNIAVDVSGGASAAQAVTALVAAIVANAATLDFTAVDGAGDTVVVTWDYEGTAGNVASTETCANASWGGATLTGGLSVTYGLEVITTPIYT